MENHYRKKDRCIAEVVFRIVGKSVNLGKVIIDTETYSFEGKLSLDSIKGIYRNNFYVVIYTPAESSVGDKMMKLFVDKKVTNPIKDLSSEKFRWISKEPFPTVELEFKKVYTE